MRATHARADIDTHAARRAHRLVMACLVLVLISIGIGGSWDRAWHTRKPFDDFFSPPHLFIYGTIAAAMCIFAVLATDRRAVSAFGRSIAIARWNSVLPGPVVLLGSGLAGIGAAGVLDAIWHSRFGLDETNLSAPHKLLGTSIFVVVLGYISCRLALDEDAMRTGPLPWVLGFLVLAGSANPIVGPFEQTSREALHAIARIPVLAADPDVRHTFRIYDYWNITRSNPLVPLVAAVWVVSAATFVRRLVKRDALVLAIAGMAALFSFLADGREARALRLDEGVAPVGIVLLAGVLAYVGARRLVSSEPLAWAASGAATSAVAFAVWGRQGDPWFAIVMVILAPVVSLGAGWFGRRAYEAVAAPRGKALAVLVLTLLAAVPLVTGSVDLWLRARTS